MIKKRNVLIHRSPWHQILALVLAIVVFLACKLVEEIQIEQDGSGVFEAELTLFGTEKQMLRMVKDKLAENPALKIVAEGPRGDDYFIRVSAQFSHVGELGNDQSSYFWDVSEVGAFTRKARLGVASRRTRQKGITEHRLEVTMPGKVVSSNADEISGRKVAWDLLAADSGEELYVETEFVELPEGYSKKIQTAALILFVGTVLLVVLRLRRRQN